MSKKTAPPKRQNEALNARRELAYLQGQNIARKLFATVLAFKNAPAIDGETHLSEFDVARGFLDGLNIALDDARSLVPAERRKHLLGYLADDLAYNAEKGMRIMGDGWISPWITHADKLAAPGGNGRRLQMLTAGLYRQLQPFDAGRCLTGLDEEFRAAAIEMLDSFSRHGRHDRAFMDAAEKLLTGEFSCPGFQ